MTIKIGNKTFDLTSFTRTTSGNRPAITFDINAKYDDVIQLALAENQTFIVHVDTETPEDIDLSSECIIFDKLTNVKNTSCILTMTNYSDIELLQQVIDELLEV